MPQDPTTKRAVPLSEWEQRVKKHYGIADDEWAKAGTPDPKVAGQYGYKADDPFEQLAAKGKYLSEQKKMASLPTETPPYWDTPIIPIKPPAPVAQEPEPAPVQPVRPRSQGQGRQAPWRPQTGLGAWQEPVPSRQQIRQADRQRRGPVLPQAEGFMVNPTAQTLNQVAGAKLPERIQTPKPKRGPAQPMRPGAVQTMPSPTQTPDIRRRTGLEMQQDLLLNLGQGVLQIPGSISNLIAPGSGVSQWFNEAEETLRGYRSEPLKQREALADAAIREAGEEGVIAQVVEAAKRYSTDPSLAAQFVFTNLPSMIPGIGAAKLAKAAALARGATPLIAATRATTAAGLTNAALNAGGARGEAFRDIQQTLTQQGVSPEEAASRASMESLVPAGVGAVTGYIGGKTGLEKAVSGGTLAGRLGLRRIGAAGAELGGEQLEEVTPQIATNLMAGRYDQRSPLRDVGRTSVETMIGAGPGAGLAAIATRPDGGAAKTPDALQAERQPTGTEPLTEPLTPPGVPAGINRPGQPQGAPRGQLPGIFTEAKPFQPPTPEAFRKGLINEGVLPPGNLGTGVSQSGDTISDRWGEYTSQSGRPDVVRTALDQAEQAQRQFEQSEADGRDQDALDALARREKALKAAHNQVRTNTPEGVKAKQKLFSEVQGNQRKAQAYKQRARQRGQQANAPTAGFPDAPDTGVIPPSSPDAALSREYTNRIDSTQDYPGGELPRTAGIRLEGQPIEAPQRARSIPMRPGPARISPNPLTLVSRNITGRQVAQRIEEGLPEVQAKLDQGKKPRPALPREVKAEYGNIAEAMHKAPVDVYPKVQKAYNLPETATETAIYDAMESRIANEMSDATRRTITGKDVRGASDADWNAWAEKYGKRKFSDQDITNIRDIFFGKGMGALFKTREMSILYTGAEKANSLDIQNALRREFAQLMNVPYDEVSLSQIPPAMWRRWAVRKGLSPEARQLVESAIRRAPELKRAHQEKRDGQTPPPAAAPERTIGGPRPMRQGEGAVEPPAQPAPAQPEARAPEQRQATGKRVNVNGQEYILTPEQEAQWKVEVDDWIAENVRFASNMQDEDKKQQFLKGVGMEAAARKRRIVGALTPKEAEADAQREASMFKGKEVSVNGRNGVVVSTPFGKVKVRFNDGTEQVVTRNEVQAPVAETGTKPGTELGTKQEATGELTTGDLQAERAKRQDLKKRSPFAKEVDRADEAARRATEQAKAPAQKAPIKIVDAEGNSAITQEMTNKDKREFWYHGTHAELSEFLPRTIQDYNSVGTWFTSKQTHAPEYGPNVYQVPAIEGNFLEVRPNDDFFAVVGGNLALLEKHFGAAAAKQVRGWPIDEATERALANKLEAQGWLSESDSRTYRKLSASREIARKAMLSGPYMTDWRAMLQSAGYDGVVFRDTRNDMPARVQETHDVYLLFHDQPIQLKKIDAPTVKEVEQSPQPQAPAPTPPPAPAAKPESEYRRFGREFKPQIDAYANAKTREEAQAAEATLYREGQAAGYKRETIDAHIQDAFQARKQEAREVVRRERFGPQTQQRTSEEKPATPQKPVAPSSERDTMSAKGETMADNVKQETTQPTPAPKMGKGINVKTLTDTGWVENSPADFTGPNGERLTRDTETHREWELTTPTSRKRYPSLREAIIDITKEQPAPKQKAAAKVEAKPTPKPEPQAAPSSMASSFAEAARATSAREAAFRAIANRMPDGTVINGWTKLTIDGDVFWQKGKRTTTNVATEVGGKALAAAAGLPQDAAYNPADYAMPPKPEPQAAAMDVKQLSDDELRDAVRKLTPAARPASPYFQEYERRGLTRMGTSTPPPVPAPASVDLGGYEQTLSPLAAAKAAKDLTARRLINGTMQTRKQYIEDAIAKGATIEIREGQPALVHMDGTYMRQQDITKTAMGYAQYLLGQKPKPEPQAEAAAPAPAPTPRVEEPAAQAQPEAPAKPKAKRAAKPKAAPTPEQPKAAAPTPATEPAITVGQSVKFKNVVDPGDEARVMRVIEDRDERVVVEDANTSMRIRPQAVYLKSELRPATPEESAQPEATTQQRKTGDEQAAEGALMTPEEWRQQNPDTPEVQKELQIAEALFAEAAKLGFTESGWEKPRLSTQAVAKILRKFKESPSRFMTGLSSGVELLEGRGMYHGTYSLIRRPTTATRRHWTVINRAFELGKPVSAASVDAYQMSIPSNYTRVGDRYETIPPAQSEAAPAPATSESPTTAPKQRVLDWLTANSTNRKNTFEIKDLRAAVGNDIDHALFELSKAGAIGLLKDDAPGAIRTDAWKAERLADPFGNWYNGVSLGDERLKAAIAQSKGESKEPWQVPRDAYITEASGWEAWRMPEFRRRQREFDTLGDRQRPYMQQRFPDYSYAATYTNLTADGEMRVRTLESAHRRMVEQALADGQDVPAEVLADYPDLAATNKGETPAQMPDPRPALRQQRDDLEAEITKLKESRQQIETALSKAQKSGAEKRIAKLRAERNAIDQNLERTQAKDEDLRRVLYRANIEATRQSVTEPVWKLALDLKWRELNGDKPSNDETRNALAQMRDIITPVLKRAGVKADRIDSFANELALDVIAQPASDFYGEWEKRIPGRLATEQEQAAKVAERERKQKEEAKQAEARKQAANQAAQEEADQFGEVYPLAHQYIPPSAWTGNRAASDAEYVASNEAFFRKSDLSFRQQKRFSKASTSNARTFTAAQMTKIWADFGQRPRQEGQVLGVFQRQPRATDPKKTKIIPHAIIEVNGEYLAVDAALLQMGYQLTQPDSVWVDLTSKTPTVELRRDGRPVAYISPLAVAPDYLEAEANRIKQELQPAAPAQAEEPGIVKDARKRLKETGTGERAGAGLGSMADQAIVTGYAIYKKGMAFAEWSRQMLRELGQAVRPHLQTAWTKIKAAAKEFWEDEEGSFVVSPGPPKQTAMLKAAQARREAQTGQVGQVQPRQVVRPGKRLVRPSAPAQAQAPTPPRGTTPPATPKGPEKGLPFRLGGKSLRSPQSTLNVIGTYEAWAGPVGREVSDAFRLAHHRISTGQYTREDGLKALRDTLKPLKEQLKEENYPGLVRMIDEHVEALSRGDELFGATARFLKSFQYNTKLRFNPRSIGLNALQPLQTLWPHFSTREFLSLAIEARKPEVRAKYAAIAAAESGGKIEGLDGKKSKFPNPFLTASDTNRIMGHLAGLRIAERMGLTGEEAELMAADWAAKVEFDNSIWNIPPLFRGNIASVAGQFKPFLVKNLERLEADWKRAPQGSTSGTLARRAKIIAGQLMIGGMRSFLLPGIKPLTGVLILGYLAKAFSAAGMDDDDANKAAETVYFGLPALLAQDLSVSVAILDEPFGETVYEQVLNFLGPTLSTAVGLMEESNKLGTALYEHFTGTGSPRAKQTPKEKAQASALRMAKRVTPYTKSVLAAYYAAKGETPPIWLGKEERMTLPETGGMFMMGTPLRQTKFYEQKEAYDWQKKLVGINAGPKMPDRQRGEPEDVYNTRVQRVEGWRSTYGPKLEGNRRFAALSEDDKKRVREMLDRRILDHAGRKKPEPRKLEPEQLLLDMKRNDKAAKTRESKQLYVAP